jgi:hypothetical protein
VLKKFVIQQDIDVLRSTAASINDTWSVPGQIIPCQGGATQLFVNPTSLIQALDDG